MLQLYVRPSVCLVSFTMSFFYSFYFIPYFWVCSSKSNQFGLIFLFIHFGIWFIWFTLFIHGTIIQCFTLFSLRLVYTFGTYSQKINIVSVICSDILFKGFWLFLVYGRYVFIYKQLIFIINLFMFVFQVCKKGKIKNRWRKKKLFVKK